MFHDVHAFSSFSVDDLDRATAFYRDTLGLDVHAVEEAGMPLLELRVAGSTGVMVYPKPDHQAATFTVLNFPVADVDLAVDELTAAGVTFEHYDGEIATDERGIARAAGSAIAWFKDPAGNIVSVLQAP